MIFLKSGFKLLKEITIFYNIGQMNRVNCTQLLDRQSVLVALFKGIDISALSGSKEINSLIENHSQKFRKDAGMQKCTECYSEDIIEDSVNGCVNCRKCGQTLDFVLDYSPEWKQFDNDDSGVRCSGSINPLLPISSLGTTLSGKLSSQARKIDNWNKMIYVERSLNNEFKKISEVCQKRKIPKCVEDDAKIMYKIASECKHDEGENKGKRVITRGNNRISIRAACIYFACERQCMSYNPKDIAKFCKIEYDEMNKGIKNLRKMIDHHYLSDNNKSPSKLIKRYCDNLGILSVYTKEAFNMAVKMEKLNIISNFNLFPVVAVCIMLVIEKHNLNIKKKKLSEELKISEATLNKTYKKIMEQYKDQLLGNTTIEKTSNKKKETVSDIPPEILEKMKLFNKST